MLSINRDRSYRSLVYHRFDGSLVHSAENSRRDSVFAIVLGWFSPKFARPNLDANCRYARSSKNCDLQFANSDRQTDKHTDIFKENYSIDFRNDVTSDLCYVVFKDRGSHIIT